MIGETKRIGALAVTALAALYVLQVITPIRLDTDSVDYLEIAARLADGMPPPSLGLPLGYPWLIALLDRAGAGNSFSFVGVNCIFIGVGLASVWYIFRDAGDRRWWIIGLSMLSWPVIRHVTLPLPEAAFFGTSLAAVALLDRSVGDTEQGRRFVWLGFAAIAIAAAVGLRLVGIALIPPLVFACFARSTASPRPNSHGSGRKAWLAAASVGALFVIVLVLMQDPASKYVGEVSSQLSYRGLTGAALEHGTRFFSTIGEIFINVPLGQVRRLLWLFFATGLLASGLAITLIKPTKRVTPAGVYFASFVILLVLWPYDAPRLWLPLIPLVIGFALAQTPRTRRPRNFSIATRAYIVWFTMTGLVALGYTTRVTLARKDFSKVYGRAGGVAPSERTVRPEKSAYLTRSAEVRRRYENRF